MPFKSEAQRRYLWKNHPDIAQRWADEHPEQGSLPAKIKENNHSKEKRAMDQKDLYNLHMEKSAASIKGIMRAAEAPAFSRMDQVGIGIATGITTGQVNNVIHDAAVDRKELQKDKDEFRKERLEDLQKTVNHLEKRLKDKKEGSPDVKKEDDTRDSFHQPKPPTPVSSMMPSNVPSSAYPTAGNVMDEKNAGLMDLFKVTDPAHPIFGYAHMDSMTNAVKDMESAHAAAAKAKAVSDAAIAAGANTIAAQKARLDLRHAAAEAGRDSFAATALQGVKDHGEAFAEQWISGRTASPEQFKKELSVIEKAKAYLHSAGATDAISAGVAAQNAAIDAEKKLEIARVAARRAANLELAATVAPHGIGGLMELAKYPSWRRAAQAETAAINAKLLRQARNAKLLNAAGIGAAALGAGALIGGALYNRRHDPIAPGVPASFPSLSPIGLPARVESGHTSSEHPISWEEKSAASIFTMEDPHAVKPVGFIESMAGGKGVGKDIGSLPRWKKAAGILGLGGGAYLAHDAVKNMGGYGKAAETYLPYETEQVKGLMSHFSPRQVEHAPKGMGWKGYAAGAAGVLGAGYLYNKMHPDGMEKQADPQKTANVGEKVILGAPLASSMHYKELLAEKAAEAIARRGGLKSLGIGLALGLAAPVVAKGIGGIYNQVQQNNIQNQMLALQQMQMSQQMGMGMNYGYTQPVAIQQGMMM